MIRRFSAILRKSGLRALRNETGSAAVEFALIAPVFVLILTATLEIGLMVRGRFALISVMSAASNHTLTISSESDGASAQDLTATIATLLAGGGRTASVNFNNAASAQVTDGSIVISNGSGSIANCYCPSRTNTGITWGGATSCDTKCGDGSVAGAFVEISAQTPFTPILGAFGFFSGDALRDYAVVRLP